MMLALIAGRYVDLHQLVACRCGARVDECCRSPAGNLVANHEWRLAPRLCPCGALPPPRCTYCPRCSLRRSRERSRDHHRRRRAAERARAPMLAAPNPRGA